MRQVPFLCTPNVADRNPSTPIPETEEIQKPHNSHARSVRVPCLLRNTNHASVGSPPLLAPRLPDPVTQGEPPVARHERTAQDIDDLDQEDNEAIARLLDLQKDGLNVVLEEDARNDALVDLVALLGHGVLVREERVVAVGAGWRADTVHGGHDGHEVLEFVEVGRRGVDGTVKRILQGRVEAAEGKLVDDVGEVEVWDGQSKSSEARDLLVSLLV